jgi:hypothetical protein
MDANEIRKIVNEVNPPVKGKPLTLTTELSGEIAKAIPFWAALLRKRDIREADGGDDYVTGLIETFSRIYTALKARNAQGILAPLDLDTLYNLDAELQKSDMGLPDEYPALEMIAVKEQGSFGAGTLMAYALFETALAILAGPGATDTRAARAPAPPQEEAPVSLVDDLLAGLPEDETSYTPRLGEPVPTPRELAPEPDPTPAPPPAPSAAQVRPAQQPPLMSLRIYTTANGIVVKGDLPATLYGVSQAYNVVATIFGQDANISTGPNGLEFSFSYAQEGVPS